MKLEDDVIFALIRLVLVIEARTNDDNHEWFDVQVAKDCSTLREALKAEKT